MEPAALESILSCCLKKDPDERWQSAGDVKLVLEQRSSMVSVRRPGRRPYWLAIGALAGIAIVLGVVHFRQGILAGAVISFAVYPPDKTAFSAVPNTTVNVPQFALSPDGRTLAFVANSPGGAPALWLRPLAEVAAQPLPGTENAQQLFWSPDNRWLGFYADGKVKKVPAAGGAVQVVTETRSDFRGGAWGPDDTIVFGNGAEPAYRVSAAGGEATLVTTPGAPLVIDRFPQFLPDGRHFLYVHSEPEHRGVYAGSLDGKTSKLVLHGNTSAIYTPAIYTRGGYLLFVDGDTVMGQAFDVDRLATHGRPFLVAEHAGHNSALYSAVSASPTGTLAYAGTISQNGRLTWFDRGGNALAEAGPEGDYTDFRLSPDERSLAASLVNAKTGTVDIWMNDLKRNNLSRFTSGGIVSTFPTWSPDGARLVYRTIQVGFATFYQKSAGGGGTEEPMLTLETVRQARIQSSNLVPTDWSPDGRHIIFSVPAPASGNDLWILPLAGNQKPFIFLATPAEEMHGNFSSDGRYVAYTSNLSGKFEVYVETFPKSDRKWTVSTNGGYEPRWRADGREIFYLSEDRKLMAVTVGPGPQFEVPTPLFQTRVPTGVNPNRTHYVPSRDGKRFLVNTQTGDSSPTPITVVLNWTTGLKK